MIVVFRDASTLARLRMLCETSPLMYRLFYRSLRLPADCHMPHVCKRIYSSTISGFAGEFTEADLARLERCLPPSSVFYREPDAQVGRELCIALMLPQVTAAQQLCERAD